MRKFNSHIARKIDKSMCCYVNIIGQKNVSAILFDLFCHSFTVIHSVFPRQELVVDRLGRRWLHQDGARQGEPLRHCLLRRLPPRHQPWQCSLIRRETALPYQPTSLRGVTCRPLNRLFRFQLIPLFCCAWFNGKHNLVIQLYSSFLTPPFLTRLYCRIGFFNYTLEIYNKIT